MIIKLLTGKTTRRLLVTVFVVLGIAAIYARMTFFESEEPYQEDRVWRVTLEARLDVKQRDTLVYIAQPYNSRHIKLISEQVNHSGLRLLSYHDPQRGHDRVARAYNSGEVYLRSTYYLQASEVEEFSAPRERIILSTERRERFLQDQPSLDLSNPRLIEFNKTLQSGAANQQELVDAIFQRVRQFVHVESEEFNSVEKILSAQRASNLGSARLMVALCRLNHIPARINTGFNLAGNKPIKPIYWVDVYDEDESWQRYDPVSGFSGKLPKTYVVFNRGDEYLFDVRNGQILSTNYYIEEDLFTIGSFRHMDDLDILEVLDLRRLDIDTRNTLILLLLLPLGVLISSFCRHVLGLFPYGTFTVTLLALAVIYSDMITTVIMGTIVIVLASLGRTIMPKSLTRVPRLSLIFTFVAMAMVLSVSVMDYFDLESSAHTILLPIVILTSLVDRFYSYWDTTGMHPAMIRLAVTVFIAMLCVPVLQNPELGNLLLRYPEAHFFTAALMLGFSAYSRRKLTDFPLLKLLGENKVAKPKTKRVKAV